MRYADIKVFRDSRNSVSETKRFELNVPDHFVKTIPMQVVSSS